MTRDTLLRPQDVSTRIRSSKELERLKNGPYLSNETTSHLTTSTMRSALRRVLDELGPRRTPDIPRSTVQDKPDGSACLLSVTSPRPGTGRFRSNGIASNTHVSATSPVPNAMLPAWRDSLYWVERGRLLRSGRIGGDDPRAAGADERQ